MVDVNSHSDNSTIESQVAEGASVNHKLLDWSHKGLRWISFEGVHSFGEEENDEVKPNIFSSLTDNKEFNNEIDAAEFLAVLFNARVANLSWNRIGSGTPNAPLSAFYVFNNLKLLDLSHNSLRGDDGVGWVAELPDSLNTLLLSDNNIELNLSNGVLFSVFLRHLPRLQVLDLSENLLQTTDSNITTPIQVGEVNNSLTTLSLSGNTEVVTLYSNGALNNLCDLRVLILDGTGVSRIGDVTPCGGSQIPPVSTSLVVLSVEQTPLLDCTYNGNDAALLADLNKVLEGVNLTREDEPLAAIQSVSICAVHTSNTKEKSETPNVNEQAVTGEGTQLEFSETIGPDMELSQIAQQCKQDLEVQELLARKRGLLESIGEKRESISDLQASLDTLAGEFTLGAKNGEISPEENISLARQDCAAQLSMLRALKAEVLKLLQEVKEREALVRKREAEVQYALGGVEMKKSREVILHKLVAAREAEIEDRKRRGRELTLSRQTQSKEKCTTVAPDHESSFEKHLKSDLNSEQRSSSNRGHVSPVEYLEDSKKKTCKQGNPSAGEPRVDSASDERQDGAEPEARQLDYTSEIEYGNNCATHVDKSLQIENRDRVQHSQNTSLSTRKYNDSNVSAPDAVLPPCCPVLAPAPPPKFSAPGKPAIGSHMGDTRTELHQTGSIKTTSAFETPNASEIFAASESTPWSIAAQRLSEPIGSDRRLPAVSRPTTLSSQHGDGHPPDPRRAPGALQRIGMGNVRGKSEVQTHSHDMFTKSRSGGLFDSLESTQSTHRANSEIDAILNRSRDLVASVLRSINAPRSNYARASQERAGNNVPSVVRTISRSPLRSSGLEPYVSRRLPHVG